MKVLRVVFLLFLFFSGTIPEIYSQGIRGEVRDLDGNPVPYAAIFIKELTRGTTCNALGPVFPSPSRREIYLFLSQPGIYRGDENPRDR